MSNEAVKLAEWCAWSDRANAWHEEHGDARFPEPEPPLVNRDYSEPDVAMSILARAVIEQDEQLRLAEVVLQSQMRVRDDEIDTLRAALKELRDWSLNRAPGASCTFSPAVAASIATICERALSPSETAPPADPGPRIRMKKGSVVG